MHEMSIAESIFDLVKDVAVKNNASKVTLVRIKAGELRGVISESLSLYFEFLSRDTIAEGARLEIETIPVSAKCEACQQVFPVHEHKFICPQCQSAEISVTEGMELFVKDIEVI